MATVIINEPELSIPNREVFEGSFAKKVGAISPDLGFFINKEALEDNKFIKEEYINMSEEESTAKAQEAFSNYVEELRDNGINVEVFHQSTKAADSIFPDWFITWRNPMFPDGVLMLSAMKNLERRKERMPEVVEALQTRYADTIDLTFFEDDHKYLELKGALVTDWENQKIYCNISDRAHEEVFDYLIEKLNEVAAKHGERRIKGIKFTATDRNKESIYHTDWMMTLFSQHVVICLSAIRDQSEKDMVIKELTDSDINVNPKEIIELSFGESENMCANMFDIIDDNDNHCVVMSKRANEHFSSKNLETIYQNYKVIVADIDIIENVGGGSTRCMLVELM